MIAADLRQTLAAGLRVVTENASRRVAAGYAPGAALAGALAEFAESYPATAALVAHALSVAGEVAA